MDVFFAPVLDGNVMITKTNAIATCVARRRSRSGFTSGSPGSREKPRVLEHLAVVERELPADEIL